jgi:arginase
MAQKIRIIGVPMDLGQSRRGVDMGPSALRVAGLQSRLKQLGHTVEDIGNVLVKQPEEQPYGEKRAKYLNEIAETCRGLAEMTERSLSEGYFPLVLGGDHSLAVGSFSGVSNHFRSQSKRVGYLWLDAHGDMNTPESSPSGNIHGMPLAAIIGYGAPELVELLGYKPKVIRGARLHHARRGRARHARRDERSSALCDRRYRRRGRKPGFGFCGPR